MIGVALVSSTAVFASSLRSSLVDTLESAISADYIVTDAGFQGLSPVVSETLADVPELEAATPIRGISGQVDGGTKNFGAVDPVAFEKLVDPDLQDGTVAELGLDELLLHVDPASDLDASIGSTVEVTFQNGIEQTLTVAGIYSDATFGNWLIGLDTLAEVSDAPARDFFVIAKLADGVDAIAGDAAVEAAMEPFPQANVQTNAEFLESQEAQINQLLLIITMLLAFAIMIAILGISITLALGVFERTREIGLLRAVGMNKRHTRRSVRWEAVIVSIFGALVGIVVGTFLGVILSLAVPDDVINKLAFNPTIIVAILVGAVIEGLVAALYPLYKASNMNVLEAIATEDVAMGGNTHRNIGETAVMALDPAALSEEVLTFLGEYHLATLTTLRDDTSPHVVAVGFSYDTDAHVAVRSPGQAHRRRSTPDECRHEASGRRCARSTAAAG